MSTSKPLELSPALHVHVAYVLGRLRAPQTYPGSLISMARAQLHLGKTLEIGAMQLLQLGGEGAPELGLWDFVAEHVRRRDLSATATDSSNRRFGGDAALRIQELQNARFYYAIMFEDIRRARLADAIRYDADHLVGLEWVGAGPGRRHGVNVEWHQTGARSQEHHPRTTGFTNRGAVVGAPLGPDADSFYAGARLDFGSFILYPWIELARLSSDTYDFIPQGPINRTSTGEDEGRYRIGSRVRVPISDDLYIEGEAIFEQIDDFAFEPGVTRTNGGVIAKIVWYPGRPLGGLVLN